MKQSEILFLLGSICTVVFVWIAFTLIHDSLTSTISSQATQAILPIQPTFNTNVINAMAKKPTVVPINSIPPQTQGTIIVTTAPQLSPTAIPLAPIAASSSSQQVSSSSGGLK